MTTTKDGGAVAASPPPDGKIEPVDEVLPPVELATFGLQHVLAMYAGAVAVPIIVGKAFKLPPEDIAFLIAADIFVSGFATILTCVGIGKGRFAFGARLPIMQGCTFSVISPILAAAGGGAKITDVFGAIIIAGFIGVLIAPLISSMRRFFPPVVIGTVILIIGVSLLPVAALWSGGGDSFAKDFGAQKYIGLAALVLIGILAIQRFGNEIMKRTSIMIGIIGGTLFAWAVGMADFGNVSKSDVIGFPTPFHFGAPTLDVAIILTMVIVMIVSMVETTGDLIAVGEIVGKEADSDTITRGLRADGFSTMLGGVFNTFPYTAFAENVGLVSLSGVKSRFVVATAGAIMVVLGLFPVLGALVAAVPLPVLGGAGFIMFGTVAAIGAKTLNKVDFEDGTNLVIVATALGIALIPIGYPDIYKGFPEWFRTIMGSGISAGTIAIVLLNYVFNELGVGKKTVEAIEEMPVIRGADEVAHATGLSK